MANIVTYRDFYGFEYSYKEVTEQEARLYYDVYGFEINIGDDDMCCIYYGKDYENVKVVKRPTEDENYLEKIGLKSGDLSEIASRRDSMVQILLPREVIDKHENDIAQDIFECADVENWNSNDLSLAITRVFSSLLGVEL